MKKLKAVVCIAIIAMFTACSTKGKTDRIVSAEQEGSTFDTSAANDQDSSDYEQSDLIKDIIAEYAKNSDKMLQKSYYDNRIYMSTTTDMGYAQIYDFNTGEIKEFPINTYYYKGSLYSVSYGKISTGELIPSSDDPTMIRFDLDGNITGTYSISNMNFPFYVLDDGRMILSAYSQKEDAVCEYYVLSQDMKSCEKLQPVMTETADGKDIYSDVAKILTVYQNELYCYTENNYRCIINMDTGDARPMDKNMGDELFGGPVGLQYKEQYMDFIGKYVISPTYDVYDIESMRKYDQAFIAYSRKFVTEKSFYYVSYNMSVKNHMSLFRYNPIGDDELIYEGASNNTKFYGVNDSLFTVREGDDIFIVNMVTHEKTQFTMSED